MGAVGGAIFHSIKGARNAPRGFRWAGALQTAKQRSPIVGGNFGVWGGLFSFFDCSLAYMRQQDDHINPIASGALTGGVLAARGGLRAATRSAIIGGVLLALIEGVNVLVTKYSTEQMRKMQEMQEAELRKAQEEQLKAFSEQKAQRAAKMAAQREAQTASVSLGQRGSSSETSATATAGTVAAPVASAPPRRSLWNMFGVGSQGTPPAASAPTPGSSPPSSEKTFA